MTADQVTSLYTITLAIVAPVAGAVIWLMDREKTSRVVAKEKSVGAHAIYKLMEQLNKMRADLDALKLSDTGKTQEIKVLEDDVKALHLLIIELLKTK